MTIRQTDHEKKGYFAATEDGKEAGRMTYSWARPDKIIVDHTEVSPDFSGRGIGKALLAKVVDFARAENLKIVPLCPFVKAQFDKDPTIADVLF